MNLSFLFAAIVVTLGFMTMPSPVAQAQETVPAPDILATLKPSHPRLLASAQSWQQIQTKRAQDAELDAFLKRGELEARALLDAPPLVYQKEGRRLLSVSRAALRRVLLLSLQFQLTKDRVFLERAQKEMLAVAAFPDWNPSHFLDSAEMTTALALGYDWLYADLDETARQTIARAIADKGLRAGIANPGWMKARSNWNSVCHGGMSLGALAIAESEPQLAAQTLQNARDFNPLGLAPYAPDGVYPEGASYWSYGTSYQVLLIAALQSALGSDWNLSQSPGFLQSASVLEQTKAPSGNFFNFFDSGEKSELDSTFFWFAQKLHQPTLLNDQRAFLKSYAAQTDLPKADSQNHRLLPLAALWWPTTTPIENQIAPATAPRFWLGRGENPLAAFRDNWGDPRAMFLALKGGHAALSHGHMDAGSFVFESDGVRWARDLGLQSYHSLESRGIDLWNKNPGSQRWSVFRIGNLSHNTLSIDHQPHNVDGQAEITHFSDEAKSAGAIVDLTPTFAGQASRVTRGFAFRAGSEVLIRDELEGVKVGAQVRFAMLTKAEISLSDNGKEATLSEKGKQLRVLLRGIESAKWEVISADPPHDYDAPNPGFRFLIAYFAAPASGKIAYNVLLRTKSEIGADELAGTELKNWPFAPVK